MEKNFSSEQPTSEQKENETVIKTKTFLPLANGEIDLGMYKDAYVEFMMELFPEPGREKENRQEIAENAGKLEVAITFAEVGLNIVGISVLEQSEYDKMRSRVGITAAYITPEYRGKGVVEKMLEEQIKQAKRLEVDSLYFLPMNKKFNTITPYLERKGFAKIEDTLRPFGEGTETLYIMSLPYEGEKE